MKSHRKYATGEIQYRRKPLITAFESRILLDGAAVATAADAITDVDVQEHPTDQDGDSNSVHSPAPVADTSQHDTDRREVAFVDTQIEDYQTLIDSLDAGVEVHLIDSGVDGLDAMVSMLHDQSNIAALHLYSHGDVGELTLGTTSLTLDSLESRSNDLQSLGASLSNDGDILLYGCFVGANDEGRAFVDRIAEISGADVAASDDLTGAAKLGGDWDLEVTSGSIETEVLAATDYATVLAPVVSNLDASLTVGEGDAAVIIDGDITFTGGTDYTEGTIRFALASSNTGDQFVLTSAADVNASGAISVVGSDVFLGNGSGRDRIGSIDETENGTNGQDLVIHFATPLTNSGFESGDLTGWTIYNSAYTNVPLDGVTTNYYYDNGTYTGTATVHVADSFSGSYSGQNQGSNVSTGSWALNLTSSGTIVFTNQPTTTDGSYKVSGYGSWFGPYAVSDPFEVQVGDQLTLDWAAQNGSDSYDVFGYLVDLGGDGTYGTGDDSRTLLFSERGSTRDWTTTSVSIASAGSYAFEFIGGTYDQTGGKAVGASLYIDNVRLISATSVNDSVASAIARQVTYQNTATDSPTSRTLTVTATDAVGGSGSDTMTINITQANNSPTFTGGATLGAVNEDTTSPSGSSVSSLFGSLFADPDEAYNPADTLAGIVVTADASNGSQGEWQYSTDSGSNWYSIGSVSTSNGLMLSTSAMLRFVPTADYNGTPGALDVYAVDSTNADPFTSGATRQTYDTTSDADGDAVATSSVTLGTSITSVNDAPTGSASAPSATLIEAGGVANAIAGVDTSSLTVSLSDVDGTPSFDESALSSNGWSTANGGVTYSKTGTYGTATLTIASGLVSYQLNDGDADTQALLPGDTVSDNFAVRIRDDLGATNTVNASFTIQGANDNPVAADAGDGAVEAGGVANATPGSDATGNLLTGSVTDVDSTAGGETKAIVGIRTGSEGGSGSAGSVGSALAGQYGSLTLNSNGSYTYVVDDDNAAVQALRVSGQQLTDSFTYTVQDAGGLQDQATFTVTIDGRNDAPVAADGTGSAVEAGGLNNAVAGSDATGNVLASLTDVDSVANGETKTVVGIRTGSESGSGTAGSVGSALAGQYGSLTLNSDGSYTYVVDDDNSTVQALRNSGEELVDNFTYTVSDTSGLQDQATLAVHIDGRNDTPVGTAGSASATLVEDGGVANGTAGTDSSELTISLADVDGSPSFNTSALTGGGWSTADSGATYTKTGTYGTATLTIASGVVSYQLDNSDPDTQALTPSDSVTDSFTVNVLDDQGATSTVAAVFAIQGANDTPVATASTASATLVESGGVFNATPGTDASALTVSITDVDGTPSFDTAYLVSNGWTTADSGLTYAKTGTYGTATLTVASGVVSYQLDNDDADTQALLPSDTVNDSFTLRVGDDLGASTTLNAVFTLQGANDNPVAANADGSAVESGGVGNATPGSDATGNLLTGSVTDVDSTAGGETKAIVGIRTGSEGGSGTAGAVGSALTGQYGTLTVNGDGSYTYVVDDNNPAVQALRVSGQQLVDNFTYTVGDAGGLQDQGTLAIHIDGRNDAPTLTDASVLETWSFGKIDTKDFAVLFNDVDSTANGEDLTFTITGLPAGLTFNADTGLVSGQPTDIGKFMLTLTAQDVAGTQISRQFELEIVGPPQSEGSTTPTETTPPPPPTTETDTVKVETSELPDGLLDNGTGDGSAYLPEGTPGDGGQSGDGLSGAGQNEGPGDNGFFDSNLATSGTGGSGADASGTDASGADASGADGNGADGNGADGSGSDGSGEGDGQQADQNTAAGDGKDDGNGTGGGNGDEIVIMSEPGAVVVESSNPDGNKTVRASVEVNVSSDGQVRFSEAQNEAFDVVSLEMSGIQRTTSGFDLTVRDSHADKVQIYSGSLGDGSPLPSWIQLDSRTGNLTFTPPEDLKELSVRIKAYDTDGHVRVLELKLDLNQLREQLGDAEEAADSAANDGFIPLSEQLQAQQTSEYGERLASLFTR